MESLPTFEAIRERRAVRHFSSRKVSDALVYELLDLANRSPSGFNLQPWHFIVVRDNALRPLLSQVALNQPQINAAPLTVVFVADPDAWRGPYEQILATSIDCGAMSPEYAKRCRQNVDLFFRTGLLGVYGVIKRMAQPVKRFIRPTPTLVTSRAEAAAYVRMQTMIAATTYMLAASGAGLATCPLEGFDEERLKRLLAIPSRMSVPILVPTGYPMEGSEERVSVRLPLSEKLSIDLFPNTIERMRRRSAS